jgi:tetratricopeptide (TPR) repeat protein
LLATLHTLGVIPSFSRPSVSNDNPYSESLFRTLKYRPEYPEEVFASLHNARNWVRWFVDWYNNAHLHSSIQFVTPAQRHASRDADILARREQVYRDAKARHPQTMALLAKCHYGNGDPQAAAETLKALIKANPDHKSPDDHMLFARSLEGMGNDDDACKECDVLCRTFPGEEVRVRYGLLLKRIGREEQASAVFRESVLRV